MPVDAGVLSNKSDSGLLSVVSAGSTGSFRFAAKELGAPAHSNCGTFIGYSTVDVVTFDFGGREGIELDAESLLIKAILE